MADFAHTIVIGSSYPAPATPMPYTGQLAQMIFQAPDPARLALWHVNTALAHPENRERIAWVFENCPTATIAVVPDPDPYHSGYMIEASFFNLTDATAFKTRWL